MNRKSKTLISAVCFIIFTVLLVAYVSSQDDQSEYTQEQIDRGEYLVMNVSLCWECHTPFGPNGPDMTRLLAGGREFIPGVLWTPNLTPDPATGIGNWTDEQLTKAITEGIGHFEDNPEGEPLFPIMLYYVFANMTADDVTSVIAFLRTVVKPVSNEVPERAPSIIPPQPAKVLDYSSLPGDDNDPGKYLTSAAGVCIECHTQRVVSQGPPDPSALDPALYFAGGEEFNVNGITVHSQNITPDEGTGIGKWTSEQIMTAIRGNMDPEGAPLCPPMPKFSGLTDGDANDIINFVMNLPPITHAVESCNTFFMSLTSGLNMISLPLRPFAPYTARSLANQLSATTVIKYDNGIRRFVGFTPVAPDDGFMIEGGKGYIVNVKGPTTSAFIGGAWTNEPPVSAAPPANISDSAWAFVVSGSVLNSDGSNYTILVRNLRTEAIATETTRANGYFAAVYADLNRKAVIENSDSIEITVMDKGGNIVSGPYSHRVTLDEIRKANVNIPLKLGEIIPAKSLLLQNFPNPFNPETWIPYSLKDGADVSIKIYDSTGKLVRNLELGHKDAGVYATQQKAAYWDGKNEAGEQLASGVYFYSIQAREFTATKKMFLAK